MRTRSLHKSPAALYQTESQGSSSSDDTRRPGTPDSTLQYALWDIASSDKRVGTYRALCISFRGTQLPEDWGVNLDIEPRLAALDEVDDVLVSGTQDKSDSHVDTIQSYMESAALKASGQLLGLLCP